MTYTELGDIRGIGRESAVKLVKRKRWRRVPGNDGEARVRVPADWLTSAKLPSPQASPDPSPDISRVINALEAAHATLRDQLQAAEQRTLAERARADVLRDRIAAMEVELRTLQDSAEALRRAEDARKGRGLMARLGAAWRGE